MLCRVSQSAPEHLAPTFYCSGTHANVIFKYCSIPRCQEQRFYLLASRCCSHFCNTALLPLFDVRNVTEANSSFVWRGGVLVVRLATSPRAAPSPTATNHNAATLPETGSCALRARQFYPTCPAETRRPRRGSLAPFLLRSFVETLSQY